MEKQVTSRQFVLIVFMIGMAVKMFMVPALILQVSGRDSYIPLSFYLIVEIFCLFCILFAMKKNPNKTFYEYMTDGFGKIFAKILVGFFAVYLIFKLTLIISETKIFFTVSVFENISWPIYVIPLLGLLGMIALKSLRGIGRVVEIFTPYIFISLLVLGILIVTNIDFSNLLPIMEDSGKGVLESITKFSVWFGDFSILVIFMGNVKAGKHLMGISILWGIISCLVVLIFSTILFATYGNISNLLDYGHNISSMTQYSIGSQSYGRFDIIIFSVWIISVFINMAIVFYTITRHITFIIGKKNKLWITAATIIIIYIMSIFVFPNENVLYNFAMKQMRIGAGITQFLMPISLALIAIFKKKKKEDIKEEEQNEE